MKPTVPETGTVIKIVADKAIIMLNGGKACKGCGAAKIGLCRPSGNAMFQTANNTAGAETGDTVILGLDNKVKQAGFVLAYLVPVASFSAGAIAGNILGRLFSVPSLDVVMAFVFMAAASIFSSSELRKLDKSHCMVVQKIVRDNVFKADQTTEEERWHLTKYLDSSKDHLKYT